MSFADRFAGKRAVVTGGASGIGFGVAGRLIAEGASVASVGPRSGGARPRRRRAGGSQFRRSGRYHVLGRGRGRGQVHGGKPWRDRHAGRQRRHHRAERDAWDYPVDAWHQVIDVNLNGLFHCNRAVVPLMHGGGYGRIVNIASVAGKEGNPNASAYSASKAAVIGLTKSLGKELAKTNITVNCRHARRRCKTAIFDQMTQAHIDFMLSKIPMGRFGTVEEIDVASSAGWRARNARSRPAPCSTSRAAGRPTDGGSNRHKRGGEAAPDLIRKADLSASIIMLWWRGSGTAWRTKIAEQRRRSRS